MIGKKSLPLEMKLLKAGTIVNSTLQQNSDHTDSQATFQEVATLVK